MTAKTTAQRAATHAAKQRAAGLVKVSAWVHRDDVAEVKRCAFNLAMCREAAKQPRITQTIDELSKWYVGATNTMALRK